MNKTIENQLRLCPTLPTISSVALRIIQIGRNPDIDLAEVARLLSKDPALATKTLRMANSPLYMRGRQARNLHQAITVLGLNATVSVALSFSLSTWLRDAPAHGIDLDRYWRRALLSALAARLLGEHQDIHVPEELFLAGLLQDLGMLALDAAMPETYGQLKHIVHNHDPLPVYERELVGTDHCEAGAWLMEEWGLPDYLVLATRGSDDLSRIEVPEGLESFVGCVAVSGRIAEIYLVEDTQSATAAAVQTARSCLNMGPDALSDVLTRMAETLPEVESLFEMTVLSPPQALGLTDQARELLATRNLQLLRSATELQEREQEFRQQAHRLDYIARQDALTGIFNRRHFDEAFSKLFAQARAEAYPLSLAYLDLDHFKEINDRYGHPIGDKILAAIAKRIHDQLRADDLFARYGGEEFVLLLPGIDTTGAQKILVRICDGISALEHKLEDGNTLTVTLSAGIATFPGQGIHSPNELMQASDHALYEAKQGGRNRVVLADVAVKSSTEGRIDRPL
ncbi:signal transduction protein [Salinisphaera shabanensis E1L3A]|uniref:diguanylate cyclase n=1 Tax=Salinisphaera shabanensis E1L3A TaxID=1033802 RepID=U2EK10_9GAMM|nr:GGDEF domain-containing protein [Salinisphaera shabanensis]ERJ18607.1 signal transduction protein [Salinisphaera shabanensis E1L3A]